MAGILEALVAFNALYPYYPLQQGSSDFIPSWEHDYFPAHPCSPKNHTPPGGNLKEVLVHTIPAPGLGSYLYFGGQCHYLAFPDFQGFNLCLL